MAPLVIYKIQDYIRLVVGRLRDVKGDILNLHNDKIEFKKKDAYRKVTRCEITQILCLFY